MILIIASVSSYFFDREKGIGVQAGKKDKGGYSRWAKEKELQSQKDIKKVNPADDEIPYAGVPLINKGKEIGRIRGAADWDDEDVIEYIYKIKAQQNKKEN